MVEQRDSVLLPECHVCSYCMHIYVYGLKLLCCSKSQRLRVYDFAVVAVDNEGKPLNHKRTLVLFLIHSQAYTIFSTGFQRQSSAHTNGQKVGAHTQVTNVTLEHNNTPLTLPIRDAIAYRNTQ